MEVDKLLQLWITWLIQLWEWSRNSLLKVLHQEKLMKRVEAFKTCFIAQDLLSDRLVGIKVSFFTQFVAAKSGKVYKGTPFDYRKGNFEDKARIAELTA